MISPVMSRVRFATVRDLFDGFASAAGDVGAPRKGSLPSLDFLNGLYRRSAVGARNFLLRVLVAASRGGRLGEPVRSQDDVAPATG
jgi:hypothetical protein